VDIVIPNLIKAWSDCLQRPLFCVATPLSFPFPALGTRRLRSFGCPSQLARARIAKASAFDQTRGVPVPPLPIGPQPIPRCNVRAGLPSHRGLLVSCSFCSEVNSYPKHEVYTTERHLLYVACTRARDHLLVTSVDPPSEFLDDLRL